VHQEFCRTEADGGVAILSHLRDDRGQQDPAQDVAAPRQINEPPLDVGDTWFHFRMHHAAHRAAIQFGKMERAFRTCVAICRSAVR